MPKTDQGVSKTRYAVIPRTLVFLTRGDHILLLKGSAQKRIWANRYNGVGGHIERGEDVLSAARRELFEETGLAPQFLSFCGTILIDAGEETGICLFVFKGESESGEPVPSDEGSLDWVTISDLEKLPLVEDLSRLLPRVLEKNPADPPFFARYFYNQEDQLEIVFGV